MSDSLDDIPYATFAIEGTLDNLRTKQSAYLLGNHKWYLKFHSVTLFQVPSIINEVFLLRCNFVQPDDTLSRELAQMFTFNWSWEQFQPLVFIPLSTKSETHRQTGVLTQLNADKVPHVHIPLHHLKFGVNYKRDYLHVILTPQSGTPLNAVLAKCRTIVHVSLYKID